MLTHSDIKLFPKAELHCHLDGSIRPETLQKIAKAQRLPISENIEEVTSHMQAPATCQNLVEYLTCFDFVLPFLQTEIALEMAAYDVMEQAAEDGIRYIEIRFAPSLSMENGLSVEETIQAVAKGISKAEEVYSIHGNILVVGMKTGEIEMVKHVFEKTTSLNHEKWVGFDLAGAEEDYFMETYKEVIENPTRINGVQVTLHAGECGCVHNMFEAIHHGATRIGHGIALKGDEKNTKKIAEYDVCLEGCPTSNVQTRAITSYKEYPFREWLESGVTFCINTDNKTVSNTTLSKEYGILLEEHQMTDEELRHLNVNGIHYSFANEALKEQIEKEMLNYTFNV